MSEIKSRLEHLRGEIRAERISYGEIAELQSLAEHIEPGDVELLEAAGVEEHPARFYDPPEILAGTVFDPEDETFGPIMAAIQAGDFEIAAMRLRAIDPKPSNSPEVKHGMVYLVVDTMSSDGVYVFADSDERDCFAERRYGIPADESNDSEVYKTDEPICTCDELLGTERIPGESGE